MRDDPTTADTATLSDLSGARQRTRSLFRTSGLIALANLLSRILSFAGDTVKSHYFGAGGLVDAFNVAAAVPTLLNDLLIQSLVNSAYIPVLNSYRAIQQDLRRLVVALVNVTTVLAASLVLALQLFAPQLVSILNRGASPETQALTVNLLHITIPALLVLNFSGILSAVLYVNQRVVLPAIASVVLNAAIVITAVVLQARLGIVALALGLLLGTLLQVALQLWGLRGIVWRYRLLLWHPGLRRILRLFSPILFGLLIEVLLSRPLTFAFASQTGEGGIAWMGYALTLRQLPEGLIASALSITVLVRLAAVSHEDLPAFRETLGQGLRLAFLLIIPAAVGLFVVAHPVTALLYEHGSFTARDTGIVVQALRCYLLGLPFATIDLLLVVAFYARHNTLTPALIGLFTTFLYIALSRLLLPITGLYGIMIADSVRFIAHAFISYFFLTRTVGGISGTLHTLYQSLLAVVVMGASVTVVASLTPTADSLLGKALAVIAPVGVGMLVYVICLALLGVRELRLLWRAALTLLTARRLE